MAAFKFPRRFRACLEIARFSVLFSFDDFPCMSGCGVKQTAFRVRDLIAVVFFGCHPFQVGCTIVQLVRVRVRNNILRFALRLWQKGLGN